MLAALARMKAGIQQASCTHNFTRTPLELESNNEHDYASLRWNSRSESARGDHAGEAGAVIPASKDIL